jgi:hypothetical protein
MVRSRDYPEGGLAQRAGAAATGGVAPAVGQRSGPKKSGWGPPGAAAAALGARRMPRGAGPARARRGGADERKCVEGRRRGPPPAPADCSSGVQGAAPRGGGPARHGRDEVAPGGPPAVVMLSLGDEGGGRWGARAGAAMARPARDAPGAGERQCTWPSGGGMLGECRGRWARRGLPPPAMAAVGALGRRGAAMQRATRAGTGIACRGEVAFGRSSAPRARPGALREGLCAHNGKGMRPQGDD